MFEERTPETMKKEMLMKLSDTLSTREGSFADDMVGPVALELYKMYRTLNAVQDMVWVTETSGKYLDMASEEIGIQPRKSGTKAEALLTLTGKPLLHIPENKKFRTEDSLNFLTKGSVTLSASGEGVVRVQAEEIGEKYNVAAATIQYQYDNDANIKTMSNLADALGGTDPESDAALYARISMARHRPSTSGNKYDYERWALEVSGVGFARVYPLWKGNGTVKVLVLDPEYRPVDTQIVAQCAVHIEEMRPVGATVTVTTATEVTVNIAATVGVVGDIDGILSRFKTAVTTYLASVASVKGMIVLAKIGAILIETEGIIDYQSLTINGKSENMPLSEEQIAVLGKVVFTGGEGNAV